MDDQTRDQDDLTRLVQGITSPGPEAEVKRAMDERLARFREELDRHPYVRRLQRRGGFRPPRTWFIAGQPVAARWAMAAFMVVDSMVDFVAAASTGSMVASMVVVFMVDSMEGFMAAFMALEEGGGKINSTIFKKLCLN